MRAGRRAFLRIATALALASIATGCGSGGGTKTVSSASLVPRLVQQLPPLHRQRTFDWSDPVDAVAQGIPIPEATKPSAAARVLRDSKYEGGAGLAFTPPNQPDVAAVIGVMKFSSAANANKVRDWMQSQALQQPCFSSCIFTPQNLPVPGVPNAKGVVQKAHPQPPPTPAGKSPGGRPPVAVGGPPDNYMLEFTLGRYVYFGRTSGTAKDGLPANYFKFAKAAYARAKRYG